MSKILSHLYVGTVEESFEDHKCECILNVASELDLINRLNKDYKKISIADDDPNEDITKIIPECLEYIETNIKQNKKVFVHCLEGKSRSICIIIAYLCIKCYLTFDQAIELVKKRSSHYDPYPNYLNQVKDYIHNFWIK